MATSYVDYTGDGNATKAFSFPSLAETDVKVEVDGVLKTVTTHYNLTSYTKTGGGNVVFTGGNIPANPAKIHIYRNTDVSTNTGEYDPQATYQAGSSVKAGDLNNNQKQSLYAIWEEKEQLVKTSEIAADAITGAKIADDQIDSEHYIAGSIDAEHLSSGSVTTVKLGADAVTSAKLADDACDSEHYTDGSIDTVHIGDLQVTTAKIAADAITSAKLADDACDSEHYTDGSIDTAHIGNLQVTTAKLASDAVDSSKLADDACDSEHYTDGSIDLIHMSANSVDSDQYVDGSIDHVHLAADCVDGDNIADDSIGAEHIQANAVGTSEIADAELVTLAGMQSGTASILASGTALTSTTAELNLLDGKSIVTTISGSSTDVQIPTAQAVDERITTVVTDVGGFVPIADKDSFPETNPDPGDNAGTIISIADAGGLVVNGSGVSTTGDTITTNATVTITGIDSTLHNTTIAAGKGMLIETTSTLNTYTYHRLVVDEAGVASAQTLVTDFNQRYQVASSTPSTQPDGTALAEGDLWFDTSANTMKVYDGSQYSVVTSVGDYKLLTILDTDGSAFDGANQSFNLKDGSSAAAVTSVGQLIVSVNGVIQKPNTGTSAPAEGFALVDADTIIFSNAPGAGAAVFVTLIGSATGVNTPATNSIVEAAIQSNVVSEEKLKISNAGSNGQFLSKQSGNSGGLTWASVTGTPEGTAVLSTGESGGTKFLREDGDGSCSWQSVPASVTQENVEDYVGGMVTGNTETGIAVTYDDAGGKLNFVVNNSSITVQDESSDTTCFPLFVTAATGDQGVKSGSNLTFNSNTGALGATSFTGDGSALTGIAAGATGGNSGGNAVFWENAQNVTHDYTITNGKNAGSFGPITIDSGATVTIGDGEYWTIV